MKALTGWLCALLIQTLVVVGGETDRERVWSAYVEETRAKAEQGDPRAQLSLADMYAHGRGLPKNSAKAGVWYRRAARQVRAAAETGDPRAQALLGQMAEMGWGVPKDYKEAAKWYWRAAQQNHARGQYGLGKLYSEGWGVEKNHIEAYSWLDLAAAQGIVEAAKLRESIARFLSPEQIEEAQRRATAFLKRLESPK